MTVQSIFGRTGPHVIAQLGDYSAGLVANDSAVPGSTVAEACDLLTQEILSKAELGGDLTGSVAAPVVARIYGREVADIVPNDGDRLTWVEANSRWEPVAPPPPRETLWDVLYEQDLRALESQVIPVAANAYLALTLDGQPWYFHTSSGSFSLVHGEGIVGSVNGDGFSGNPYAGVHFGLRVYAIDGFDPLKETACQVQFSGSMTNVQGGPFVGASTWSGGEQWGYGPGNNADIVRLSADTVRFSHNVSNTVSTSSFLNKVSGLEELDTWALATSTFPIDSGGSVATRVGNRNYRSAYFRRDVVGLPSMEQMVSLGTWNGLGSAESSSTKMGFYAGVPSGNFSFKAIRIRVLQRTLV